MEFTVKLDCPLNNPAVLMEHQTALMAAFAMMRDYQVSRDVLIGTGPELYAEQWLRNFTNYSHNKFGNLIIMYFGKILWTVNHV